MEESEGRQKETAVFKPRTEASEETKIADPLILDFHPQEQGENEFCCLAPPAGSMVFCYGSGSKLIHLVFSLGTLFRQREDFRPVDCPFGCFLL